MTVFVDTSALYAVLDREDSNHAAAKAFWIALLERDSPLVTTNYVLLETTALLQHRIGLAAVRAFYDDIIPVLQVEWITEDKHRAAIEAVLAASRKKLSLVDCASFQTARNYGVREVFCFDAHFREQGFTVRP